MDHKKYKSCIGNDVLELYGTSTFNVAKTHLKKVTGLNDILVKKFYGEKIFGPVTYFAEGTGMFCEVTLITN